MTRSDKTAQSESYEAKVEMYEVKTGNLHVEVEGVSYNDAATKALRAAPSGIHVGFVVEIRKREFRGKRKWSPAHFLSTESLCRAAGLWAD